ncbi:hypothetical protein BSKO_09226 [Bryopsis sp. KO-2023]|nr:hypothetical protein BSKO_09226 [Bryopsis sp. KO-2023]
MRYVALRGVARSPHPRARVPQGKVVVVYFCTVRTDPGKRGVWDDVEEFQTATVKVCVPLVEWRDDFAKNYSLEEEAAAGSFGTIWRGSDKKTGEPVTVKKLQMQRGSLTKERFQEGVEQEVDVLTGLQGPHGTVPLHGVFIEDDHYNVVMNFCGGSDLKVLVQVRCAGMLISEFCSNIRNAYLLTITTLKDLSGPH